MHTDASGLPVVVLGAGPAGLMAAEQLSAAGHSVHLYEAMPTPARKFLRAGVGGLNLTHSEPSALFAARYSTAEAARWVESFGPAQLMQWAHSLGIESFTGSSGRVFPKGLKAAPLLRAWLRRLDEQGVQLHTRHRWLGFRRDAVTGLLHHEFLTPTGPLHVTAATTVFALGGASWARLGSDGKWLASLANRGVSCTAFTPSNCGFDYAWSQTLLAQYAGAPLKSVALSLRDPDSQAILFTRKGEALISRTGIQGGVVYAASRDIMAQLQADGVASLYWDLFPERSSAQIAAQLSAPRGSLSVGNWLRKRLGLTGLRLSLFFELSDLQQYSPSAVAHGVKNLRLAVTAPRPLDEAISTGGGVCLPQLDAHLMLRDMPGLFFAGEMLDWDAPTGGYLLTACLASGLLAGQGALHYLCAQG